MITLFGQTYAWTSPEVLLIGGLLALLVGLLLLTLRSAGKSAKSAELGTAHLSAPDHSNCSNFSHFEVSLKWLPQSSLACCLRNPVF